MITGVQAQFISPADRPLYQAAQKLEASFLAEMLKVSETRTTESNVMGGAGEEQFQSFLWHAQAEKMVEAGGIGLAEHLYQSLIARK